MFGLFQSDADKIRQKIHEGFEDAVKSAVKHSGNNDPMFLGLMVQAAIGSFYQSMKGNATMIVLCDAKGIDYESILEDECKKTLDKYLQ